MARKTIEDEPRRGRITITMTPTMLDQINLLAVSQSVSPSEFIIQQLAKVVRKNQVLLDKFQSARDAARSEFVEVD